ncbi:7043_t:CDS:2, partial [Funneliformis mosseae]
NDSVLLDATHWTPSAHHGGVIRCGDFFRFGSVSSSQRCNQ